MTAGAILSLVSNIDSGINYWINNDPQITFFKTVYRRHTPFAIEHVDVKFNSDTNFGKTITSQLNIQSDLITNIIFSTDIPQLSASFVNSKTSDIIELLTQTNFDTSYINSIFQQIDTKSLDILQAISVVKQAETILTSRIDELNVNQQNNLSTIPELMRNNIPYNLLRGVSELDTRLLKNITVSDPQYMVEQIKTKLINKFFPGIAYINPMFNLDNESIMQAFIRLEKTPPIIVFKSFVIQNSSDLLNDSYNRVFLDPSFQSNFKLDFNLGSDNNTISTFSKHYNRHADQLATNIQYIFNDLIETYANLFESTTNLYFIDNTTDSNIYAYIAPDTKYMDENGPANTLNLNSWYFYFFKYLDMINTNSYIKFINDNTDIKLNSAQINLITALMNIVKTSIEFYLTESSYYANDLYSNINSTNPTDTLKTYSPSSTSKYNRSIDISTNLFAISYCIHRNHLPSINDIFDHVFSLIDNISLSDINELGGLNLKNIDTVRSRNIVKMLYQILYQSFLNSYNNMSWHNPVNINIGANSDETVIRSFVLYMLYGTVDNYKSYPIVNLTKYMNQMEFYFNLEYASNQELSNFYTTVFDTFDNNLINIIKKDLIQQPDEIYYRLNNARYIGKSYADTVYKSRFYDVLVNNVPIPYPYPPSYPYGVDPDYYNHQLIGKSTILWLDKQPQLIYKSWQTIGATDTSINWSNIKHSIAAKINTNIDKIITDYKNQYIAWSTYYPLIEWFTNTDFTNWKALEIMQHIFDIINPDISYRIKSGDFYSDELNEIEQFLFEQFIDTKLSIVKKTYSDIRSDLILAIDQLNLLSVYLQQDNSLIDIMEAYSKKINDFVTIYEYAQSFDATWSDTIDKVQNKLDELGYLNPRLCDIMLNETESDITFMTIRKLIDLVISDTKQGLKADTIEQLTKLPNTYDIIQILLDIDDIYFLLIPMICTTPNIYSLDVPLYSDQKELTLYEYLQSIKSMINPDLDLASLHSDLRKLCILQQNLTDVLIRTNKPNTAWIEKLGHFLLEQVDLKLNGRSIQSYNSDIVETNYNLNLPLDKINGWNKMIGHQSVLTTYSTDTKPSYQLYVPLLFYFCKSYGLALPLCASLSTKYTVDIKLRNLDQLTYRDIFSELDWPTNLTNTKLIVEYIYLSGEERNVFTTKLLQYLITQYQYNSMTIDKTTKSIINDFYGSCKYYALMARPIAHIDIRNRDQRLYLANHYQWDNYGILPKYDLTKVNKIKADVLDDLIDNILTNPKLKFIHVLNQLLLDISDSINLSNLSTTNSTEMEIAQLIQRIKDAYISVNLSNIQPPNVYYYKIVEQVMKSEMNMDYKELVDFIKQMQTTLADNYIQTTNISWLIDKFLQMSQDISPNIIDIALKLKYKMTAYHTSNIKFKEKIFYYLSQTDDEMLDWQSIDLVADLMQSKVNALINGFILPKINITSNLILNPSISPIESITLKFNDLQINPPTWSNTVNHYLYTKSAKTNLIHFYSWSLNPDSIMPQGSANLSMIDEFTTDLHINNKSYGLDNNIEIIYFVESYNILRFMSSISDIMWIV